MKTFTDEINEAENLDQIWEIQVKFIENILEKSLLSPSRLEIYKQITKIFELIHKFKFTQDVLYTAAAEEI